MSPYAGLHETKNSGPRALPGYLMTFTFFESLSVLSHSHVTIFHFNLKSLFLLLCLRQYDALIHFNAFACGAYMHAQHPHGAASSCICRMDCSSWRSIVCECTCPAARRQLDRYCKPHIGDACLCVSEIAACLLGREAAAVAARVGHR